MAMRDLKFEQSYMTWISFADTPIERAMSECWSSLNLNWGRVEYFLYLIPLSVDPGRAHEWTIDFFADISLEDKQMKVRRESRVILDSDQQYENDLEVALCMLGELCTRRNKLIHGLWKRIGDGQFEVQPLRLDRDKFSLDAPIVIGCEELTSLHRLQERVCQRLAAIGTETLAGEFLRKYHNRRLRAREEHHSETTSNPV
jgi:hypothetical protein